MERKETTALEMTIRHFQRIAQENRFAENAAIAHDTDQCLVCHPNRCDDDPFKIYVDIIAHCIPVRRPRVDSDLVAAIAEDSEWSGEKISCTVQDLLERRPQALKAFRLWIRNALETGLELLSVHSSTSLSFSLDDAEGDPDREAFVENCMERVMNQIFKGNPS